MKKILSLIVAASLTFGLASCLKDDEHMEPFSLQNTGYLAEIAGLNVATDNSINQSFAASTAPSSFTFNVKIASPNPPTQDIQVTVAASDSALALYNNVSNNTYTALPAAAYKILTPTVTVKAGTRFAPVSLQLNTSAIDPTQAGALAIKIVSATGGAIPSANFGYVVLVPKVQNAYEGNYHSTGYFTHPNPAVSRAIDRDKFLQTIDAQTVQTEFADLGGNGWTMNLRINADNTVTLTPSGSANPNATQVGVNTYDPATKTFTLNYQYPGSGGNRVITETIKPK